MRRQKVSCFIVLPYEKKALTLHSVFKEDYMKGAILRNRIKPWMLPIAMVFGAIFHEQIGYLSPFAPYLIFIMLFITFCKVKLSEFTITHLSWALLFVQVFGALLVYFALLPFSKDLAVATFICVFCPTATAAPVVTGMLGGSVTRLATYSIVSNLTVAVLSPVLFSLLGGNSEISLLSATLRISVKVVPLIIAPLALALLMRKVTPKLHHSISQHQSISFYIWSVSLLIVVGNAVSYIIRHHENVLIMLLMAFSALVVCCLQFYVGRKFGCRYGDRIVGAQGLGQKNTVLAVWMALTFFHPVTSVGPAAYIAWQNIINSYQLWRKSKTSII